MSDPALVVAENPEQAWTHLDDPAGLFERAGTLGLRPPADERTRALT